MAFTLVRNGLMFFFALFICSFSLISCERPTVREGNSQTQKRYNELLEEVERSYSKMKLPRLNGKVTFWFLFVSTGMKMQTVFFIAVFKRNTNWWCMLQCDWCLAFDFIFSFNPLLFVLILLFFTKMNWA